MWNELKRQWMYITFPTGVSMSLILSTAIMFAVEQNGKRILTTFNWTLFLGISALIHTGLLIYGWMLCKRGMWSKTDSQTKGQYKYIPLFAPIHYGAFQAYITIACIGTLMEYGLAQTFYALSTNDQRALWDNFDVPRYDGVSLTYQRIESRFLQIASLGLAVFFAVMTPAAGVLHSYYFPKMSSAINVLAMSTADKKGAPVTVLGTSKSQDESGSEDDEPLDGADGN